MIKEYYVGKQVYVLSIGSERINVHGKRFETNREHYVSRVYLRQDKPMIIKSFVKLATEAVFTEVVTLDHYSYVDCNFLFDNLKDLEDYYMSLHNSLVKENYDVRIMSEERRHESEISRIEKQYNSEIACSIDRTPIARSLSIVGNDLKDIIPQTPKYFEGDELYQVTNNNNVNIVVVKEVIPQLTKNHPQPTAPTMYKCYKKSSIKKSPTTYYYEDVLFPTLDAAKSYVRQKELNKAKEDYDRAKLALERVNNRMCESMNKLNDLKHEK